MCRKVKLMRGPINFLPFAIRCPQYSCNSPFISKMAHLLKLKCERVNDELVKKNQNFLRDGQIRGWVDLTTLTVRRQNG